EQCHWANEFAGVRLKVISHFAEDETNTQTKSVLLMLIGGSNVKGIHGSHFGPGVKIRFAASDPKRQTIPWVEYANSVTGKTKEFYASSAKPDTVSKLPVYGMQCVDCHNRP